MFAEKRRADLMILRTVNITVLRLGEVIQMSGKDTHYNGAVSKAQENPSTGRAGRLSEHTSGTLQEHLDIRSSLSP